MCTESKPADETLNAPTLNDKMALVNQKAESKVSLTMLMTSLTVPYPIRPPLIADCPYPVSEPLRASSPCPMRCRAVELTFHMDPIACALPDDLLPAVLPALAVPHCPPFLSPHLFASALLSLLPSSLPPLCAPSALLDHIPSIFSFPPIHFCHHQPRGDSRNVGQVTLPTVAKPDEIVDALNASTLDDKTTPIKETAESKVSLDADAVPVHSVPHLHAAHSMMRSSMRATR